MRLIRYMEESKNSHTLEDISNKSIDSILLSASSSSKSCGNSLNSSIYMERLNLLTFERAQIAGRKLHKEQHRKYRFDSYEEFMFNNRTSFKMSFRVA